MRRAGWAVLVTALCCVAAVIWWRYKVESVQPDAQASTPAQSGITVNGEPQGETQRVPEPAPSLTTPPPFQAADYAARLRSASDYLDFARSLLGAARAGDHAAQFFIFRAFDYCAIEYRAHVDRGRIRRSLDEALTWAATHWPYDSEAVRLIYDRCHTFMQTDVKDLGTRGEWLRKASDGGYPIAQATAANRQRLEGVSTSDDEASREKESRRLMSLAIRSRDPEVLWEVASSSLEFALKGGDPDANHFAWLLAACQRGLDCSAQSERMKMACRMDTSCQPYETVTDIFRRWRADGFFEIEGRARWINEKIDAGDWEALGF